MREWVTRLLLRFTRCLARTEVAVHSPLLRKDPKVYRKAAEYVSRQVSYAMPQPYASSYRYCDVRTLLKDESGFDSEDENGPLMTLKAVHKV